MTDKLERFEKELAGLCPAKPSEEMIARIEADLGSNAAVNQSDKWLISAIGAGALAACVIVGVLLGDSSNVSPKTMNLLAETPRRPDYSLAFAGADLRWIDTLK